MAQQLTSGAVLGWFTSPITAGSQPQPKTIQVLKIIKTQLPSGQPRSRWIVSDGAYHINTLMPTKALTEGLLSSDSVKKNSVVRITEYALKDVRDKKNPEKKTRLILATKMEVVTSNVDGRLGNPVDVLKDADAIRKRAQMFNRPDLARASAAVQRRKPDDNQYDPISSLNPYRNRWTIKARVTKRGDKKTWSNSRSEGQLFSVDLLDSEGTEIRATFWKDAVDLFYDVLEEGAVATFSGGKLKMANKQYTSIKNEYEITFDRSAQVNRLADDDSSIKSAHFDFVQLSSIEQMDVGENLDVLAIITSAEPFSTIQAKSSGRELFKRDLTLLDQSLVSVRLTVWGAEAQKDDEEFNGNPVICIKGARIGEFQGKNLSTGFNSTVLYNADTVPEVQQLKAWWSSTGSDAAAGAKSLSSNSGSGRVNRFENRKGISHIKLGNLGYNEKPDFFDTKATIGFIKRDGNFSYPACPEQGNNKKVVEQSDGSWLCEATGKSYDAPEHRYILPFAVNDHTGSTWCSAFNDQALEIMGGITAGELLQLKEQDESKFEAAFTNALFQELTMTLRCNTSSYKDETRVRVNVQRCAKVNYVQESKNIIGALHALE